MSVLKMRATGAVAISESIAVPTGQNYQLVSVTLNLNTAPTTSENFTVTINDAINAVYDVVIYSLNLASGSTTDLVYQPTFPLILSGGDSLDIAYTNTDTKTYGLVVTFKAV